MCDYLINGLSLNKSIRSLILNNIGFSKKCIQSWSLCFAVNTTLNNIESKRSLYIYVVNYGFYEESAEIFFHTLKYSKSITKIKLLKCKFLMGGFRQLGLFLQQNKSLVELTIEDLENLGGCVYN